MTAATVVAPKTRPLRKEDKRLPQRIMRGKMQNCSFLVMKSPSTAFTNERLRLFDPISRKDRIKSTRMTENRKGGLRIRVSTHVSDKHSLREKLHANARNVQARNTLDARTNPSVSNRC